MRGRVYGLAALVIAAALAMPVTASAQNVQQEKMKTCSAQAREKSLRGAERRSFMSECLAKQRASRPLTPQQQKMKDCNVKASEQKLKGMERRKFMSSCLKG